MRRLAKDYARRKQVSCKEAFNTLIRRGFVTHDAHAGQPLRVQVVHSPFRAGIDSLKLNQLSDDLEPDDAASLVPGR